ncbi:MAG: hypothetical protein QM758_21545 [Armatimonas sp.]
MATITVFAEDMSDRESGRYKVGEFDSYNEALTFAARRVDAGLVELLSPGQSARDLMDQWTHFGEDVFLVPDEAANRFSALDFVRLRTLAHTNDSSRPLVYDVVCTDRINTSSGFSSPPSQWEFWVYAPATYSGAEYLLRRAIDVLYEDMSQKARLSDGSTYTLLQTEIFLLSDEETVRNTPPGVRYSIQLDGSFQRING